MQRADPKKGVLSYILEKEHREAMYKRGMTDMQRPLKYLRMMSTFTSNGLVTETLALL